MSSVPDPFTSPTISVTEAGALFGFGRSKAYQEARRFLATEGTHGLPTIAFGRAMRCPTAHVLALLGIAEERRSA